MNDTIQYAVDSDGIALLTIDLPGKSMNVLTPELMEDLAERTGKAAADDAVRGIVLTSGKKAFIVNRIGDLGFVVAECKRHQRDREEAIRFANDRLLKEMIPVLDNLERAVEHADQGDDDQGLLEGVNMTINQFRKVLEDFGVKPINALGEGFDPNLHQAMGQVESQDQAPNTVVSELQKGYLLNDRLLRPSLVMVAKAPSGETNEQGSKINEEE